MIRIYPAPFTRRVRKPAGGVNMRRVCLRILLVLSASGSVGFVAAQQDAPRAGRFRVPEVNEDGVLTSMLTGASARMVPGQPLEIEKLAIYFFEEDGETVRMRVSSPTCLYDDRRGIATSEDEVRIEGNQFTIDGRRFIYQANEERMEIFEDVVVVLRNVGGGSQQLTATEAVPAAADTGAEAETETTSETVETP